MPFETRSIRRRQDGSIDIAHYMARGRRARSRAAGQALAGAARALTPPGTEALSAAPARRTTRRTM